MKLNAIIRTPNARFWEYIGGNGWVKITLRPGQRLSWEKGGRTEEGWSYTGHRWTYEAEAGLIVGEIKCDGTDCDGRLSEYHAGTAALQDLRAIPAFQNDTHEGKIIHRPDWQLMDSERRDHQAEAAGY